MSFLFFQEKQENEERKVEDIGLEPITSNMPCLRSTR